MAGMADTKTPPPAGVKRMHEHRLAAAPGPILPAAPFGHAEAQETGRPEAGAIHALIGKALHQMRAVALRANEEAGQADHAAMQMVPSLFVLP